MPRAGQAFPITDEWRAAVEAELQRRGMKRAALASASGVGRSTITAILGGATRQSPLLPAIHAALGWPPPQAPIPSRDGPELGYIFDHLSETNRAALLERARTMLEMQRKK